MASECKVNNLMVAIFENESDPEITLISGMLTINAIKIQTFFFF